MSTKAKQESGTEANDRVYPLDIAELEKAIGHTFGDISLLRTALTHSSYANEAKIKGVTIPYNERLEFLGDSILSLIVSEYLFTRYPNLPEGELSRIRSGTVCERALGKYANQISLGNYILIGHGEEMTNGRSRVSILADAFEAVLAAVFLDHGIDTVRKFVVPLLSAEIKKILRSGHTDDFKTTLQQIVQQEQGEVLEYVLTETSGPAHSRMFKVEARLNSNVIGRGEAKTKREAEQIAAREAVRLFGGEVD